MSTALPLTLTAPEASTDTAPSLLTSSLLPLTAIAKDLDSTADPAAGSGMPTLQELYDYLMYGVEPSTPGTFQEPVAGPPVASKAMMKTLKELYDDFKAVACLNIDSKLAYQ